ncbi:serine/arginine repetitive matrix protein 2-like isoform X2 [Amphibalanus amphitrite]|uniref:serine/arginine repetitive matrix protein 2-like isoform X2 n=1 Tax=Amphibalanus amphitrite TaxID=1232801 RepID=UPI001C91AD58|nr:serine/arginine repetitive matrix protein 2-like isoform X2 [Amphibalanus amphitrite]
MADFWSERAEERLIEAIKEYTWLFDCKHRWYKDKNKKQNSWMELAGLFGDGIGAPEVERHWLLMRDRYRRAKKASMAKVPSGSSRQDAERSRPRWPLFEAMDAFLARHTCQRRRGGDSFSVRPASQTSASHGSQPAVYRQEDGFVSQDVPASVIIMLEDGRILSESAATPGANDQGGPSAGRPRATEPERSHRRSRTRSRSPLGQASPAEPTRQRSVSPAEPRQRSVSPAEPTRQRSVSPAEPRQRSVSPAEPRQRSVSPAEPRQRSVSPAEPTRQRRSPAEPRQRSVSPAEPRQRSVSPAEPTRQRRSPAGRAGQQRGRGGTGRPPTSVRQRRRHQDERQGQGATWQEQFLSTWEKSRRPNDRVSAFGDYLTHLMRMVPEERTIDMEVELVRVVRTFM